jgi:RHS repeat-associated protein
MNKTVAILKRVNVNGTLKHCPTVDTSNGKIRADVVLVNGKEERHPEDSYYLSFYEGSKQIRVVVGKEVSEAVQARERKEAELRAKNAGVEIVDTKNGNGKKSLAIAVAEYLDETKLTKKPKTLAYGYDLLGDETSRNLNGSTYSATYNAAARLTSFTATDYTDATNPANLLSSGGYDAFGHLISATFANGLSQSWAYDNRGRPHAMAVGTSCSAGACSGSTVYSYGVGYSGDGDVLSATDSVNGTWSYTYDGFNRLAMSNCSATCPNGTSTEGFSYVYDRYGNRWQQNGPSTMLLTFSNSQNQMDGYTYDAAGNLTNDKFHSYTYDAENRIISVDNGATTYAYDADGQRVAKTTSGSTTDYIYDREGRVMLYNSNPASGSSPFVEVNVAGLHLGTYVLNSTVTDTIFYYDHADWLGTERARTNLAGTACETITSSPFGDGQTMSGTCVDISPMHFTGKERDSESGLDNFGARYNASTMGRFMTPDSPSYSNHKNPQSWNLYAYALNNPVSFRDADGHKIDCVNNATQCQADAAAATGNAQAASQVTTQTTTTQHSFLGLFHWTTTETQIAITGDVNAFRALSPNASKLADLVQSKDTISVSYDQYAKPSFWANGIPLNGGSLSFTPSQGYGAQAFIDPTRSGAVYDPDAVSQGIPQANTAEEFGHEVLGHIWGEMFGGAPAGTRANMRDSIAGEDAVRALDPARGQKGLESHHNYNEMPPDTKQ